jgi:sulfotransferase
MRKIHFVSGLPRSGSSLLVNILNSNPKFHSTSTSGMIDIVNTLRTTFSHNITWKTNDRVKNLENFKNGIKGFIKGYYNNHEVVFDKSRGWTNKLQLMDHILDSSDSKIIWTYRNVADIVGSIEEHYTKTLLLENLDEQSNKTGFSTLDRRIGQFINEGSLVGYPVEILKDAIEQGYLNRIIFITYGDLVNNSQKTLDIVHDFIGEERYVYDFNNIKQTVTEDDSFYNYKFPHTIREGKLIYKESKNTLPIKYQNIINKRFEPLNKLIFEGDVDYFLSKGI